MKKIVFSLIILVFLVSLLGCDLVDGSGGFVGIESVEINII